MYLLAMEKSTLYLECLRRWFEALRTHIRARIAKFQEALQRGPLRKSDKKNTMEPSPSSSSPSPSSSRPMEKSRVPMVYVYIGFGPPVRRRKREPPLTEVQHESTSTALMAVWPSIHLGSQIADGSKKHCSVGLLQRRLASRRCAPTSGRGLQSDGAVPRSIAAWAFYK